MIKHNKSNPCPKCGKGYCYSWSNEHVGSFTHCRRVSEGSIRINQKDGFYVHRVDMGDAFVATAHIPKEQVLPASFSRCDLVYRALLDHLELRDRDYQNLLSRGFTETEIEKLGYMSVRNVAGKLIKAGLNLERVPGFYFDRGHWTMLDIEGFFIPVRKSDLTIHRMQIRTIDPDTRYMWFSSADKMMGAGSGTVAHFRCEQAKFDGRIWVTEAPLKADYLSIKLGIPVIGIAGVNSAHIEVAESLPQFKPSGVVIAFDGNWRTNLWVAKALARLAYTIKQNSTATRTVAVWDSECGIDDALEAKLRVTELTYANWFNELPFKFQGELKKDINARRDAQRRAGAVARDRVEKLASV